MDKEWTVWGECLEVLDLAAERVCDYMDKKIGRNAIHYQIIGQPQRLPYDTGFITDADLAEMQLGFIIVQE